MKYLYLLATLLFASCDIPCPLLFNGREVYQYSSECGNIILSGYTNCSDHITIESHGRYSFALDSIRLLRGETEVPRQYLRFYSDNVLLGDSVHMVTSKEKSLLRIQRTEIPTFKLVRNGKMFLLLSNSIKYKDSAVIQDTIVITKGRRQKLLR